MDEQGKRSLKYSIGGIVIICILILAVIRILSLDYNKNYKRDINTVAKNDLNGQTNNESANVDTSQQPKAKAKPNSTCSIAALSLARASKGKLDRIFGTPTLLEVNNNWISVEYEYCDDYSKIHFELYNGKVAMANFIFSGSVTSVTMAEKLLSLKNLGIANEVFPMGKRWIVNNYEISIYYRSTQDTRPQEAAILYVSHDQWDEWSSE